MDNCIFCNQEFIKNDLIHETDNFFVKIGIGIAAPGHVLLIPKKHYLCFADIADNLFDEFMELKNLVFNKVKENFSTPFIAEYGILGQTVAHAHMHFIPKTRKETRHYKGYAIGNLFTQMGIPANLIHNAGTREKIKELREKFGGYIYLEDGKAFVFSEFSDNYSHKNLSYRRFLNLTLHINDVPLSWKNITDEQKRIDDIKKTTTKMFLKF